MIVAFGTDGKGGTSKTTSAVNTATERTKNGYKTLLVDADDNQNASTWATGRVANKTSPEIEFISDLRGKDINKRIDELSAIYDDIIIDLDGRDSVEMRSLLTVIDKIYIPLLPSQPDAWTLVTMEEIIGIAKTINPKLEARVVITRASVNPLVKEIEEAQAMYSNLVHINLSKAVIKERIAFRHAFREGLSITEYQPKNHDAINEFIILYNEIYEK